MPQPHKYLSQKLGLKPRPYRTALLAEVKTLNLFHKDVMGVKIQGNKIYLPKLGWMRFHKSRPISGSFTIKACAVRRRQNGWYVSIRIEDKSIPDYTTKPLKGVDKSNRDGEKFICTECGYHEHADIGAAKTIRDRALNLVRGDSAKPGVSA
ncbi:MAG: hypothetical protein ACM65L_16815 [Microcoleus sp.]